MFAVNEDARLKYRQSPSSAEQRPHPYRTIQRAPLGVYLTLTLAVGILLCDGTLHPVRRSLTSADQSRAREMAQAERANLQDVSIQTTDKITLHAWLVIPDQPNTRAVILLHGLSDDRVGMTGYAELLLRHHYTVLQPDSRAHGASAGSIATYGLLERRDIRDWYVFLNENQHPTCIYGLGESMGAAQLLQGVAEEPNFCAVVAESSFSNFHEIAYDRVGQFFHTGTWLGRTLFRPAIASRSPTAAGSMVSILAMSHPRRQQQPLQFPSSSFMDEMTATSPCATASASR